MLVTTKKKGLQKQRPITTKDDKQKAISQKGITDLSCYPNDLDDIGSAPLS